MTESRTVVFFGDTFGLNPDVSEFALLEFAEAASDGQDGDTMEGLASMMRLVKECVVPADVVDPDGTVVAFGVKRFLATARKHKAGSAELTKVIQAAFAEATDRPTVAPSDSSDGRSAIEPKSTSSSDDSPSRLDGRPDLRAVIREDARRSA